MVLIVLFIDAKSFCAIVDGKFPSKSQCMMFEIDEKRETCEVCGLGSGVMAVKRRPGAFPVGELKVVGALVNEPQASPRGVLR